MGKIFHIMSDDKSYDERGYDERGYSQRSHEQDDEHLLEKAFKEGCEHGYKKAMREFESYNERGGRMGGRIHYREGFEEKIERLKEKYK